METPFSRPGRFWRGNLHTHSTLSDGHRSPEEVCRFYETAGYDFLALTEHFLEHYGWPLVDTRPFRTGTFTTLLGAELHPAQDRMELGAPWHILAVGLPLDFAPSPLDETGPELARRALEAGAFVVAAHPQWFTMTDRDVMALGPVHAIEIFNASCADDNDSADSAYMLDMLLAREQRLTACATDDAHFVPNTHDRTAGWVMARSETNDPNALLAALKAGDYYASSGPEIYDLVVEPGERLWLRCSPVDRIFLIGGPARYQTIGEQGITEGEFDLRSWTSPYARVLVRDGVAAGSSVLAVWRPEAASVVDPLQAPPDSLRGRIELVTFLGPITRLDVRIDDDPDADLVLVDLVSGTARHVAIGQEVALSVPPDAIRLYA